MYCKRLAAGLSLLFLAGCRHAEPPVQRLAILRFENLTPDPKLDWMGRAASEILIAGLSASPRIYVISSGVLRSVDQMLGARPVSAPGVSAERAAALAAGASGIVSGQISRVAGKLRVDANLYNTGTQRIERSASASGPESDGILPLTGSLAHQLADANRPFPTRSEEALKLYISGLEAPAVEEAVRNLSEAVAVDRDFGPAYLGWFQTEAGRRRVQEAERVLQLAKARGGAVDELSRLRLDGEAARFHGDSAGAARVLEAIARLTPADLSVFRNLAEAELNTRRYGQAIQHFRKALEIEPADPALWNLLGYAQAYAGDLPAATKSLREYERLRPAEANPLDSLGDVHFYLGYLADAERFYLQAQAKDATFANGGSLLKAAWARLMTGDINAADAIFRKYIDSRRTAGDALIEYRQAQWDFMAGRRRPAMERLTAFANTASAGNTGAQFREIASNAYTQLTVWNLDMGDSEEARANALKARANAGPSSAAAALIAGFLTEPAHSASDWMAKAGAYFPPTVPVQFRRLSLAYALLFAKEFRAAEPILRELYETSGPTAQQDLPVSLAWTLIETDRRQEAAPLVGPNPIPRPTGPDLFTCMAFPRLFVLRAQVLEKQGKRDEAKPFYALFAKLSGPDPDIFARAAKSLP